MEFGLQEKMVPLAPMNVEVREGVHIESVDPKHSEELFAIARARLKPRFSHKNSNFNGDFLRF